MIKRVVESLVIDKADLAQRIKEKLGVEPSIEIMDECRAYDGFYEYNIFIYVKDCLEEAINQVNQILGYNVSDENDLRLDIHAPYGSLEKADFAFFKMLFEDMVSFSFEQKDEENIFMVITTSVIESPIS